MARKIEVQILGDSSSLERAFRRSSGAATQWTKGLERATRGSVVATVGFRGLGRSVAFASGAFLGGAGFTFVLKSAVSAASDLNEEINKSSVLFGRSARDVLDWSRTTAKALGVSQQQALAAAAGFGSMLKTAGLTSDEAAKFSTRLVELAADMASFNNIDPTEALQKLRSGLAGEAEPLRQVGVLLSETRVKQEAYQLGLAKTGATLTEQQKVLARYSLILKDTAVQQGDFARTSGGLANQQRILAAQVENLKALLGQALLPDVLKIVSAVNDWLASSENQAKIQDRVNNSVRTAHKVFSALLAVLRPLARATKQVSDAMGGLENTVKLLVIALVVSKVLRFTGAITGLSAGALAARGSVLALRLALLRLTAIGLITIGVAVLLNKKEINRKVNDFLRSRGLGFIATKKIELPVNIGKLEGVRRQLLKIKDAGDPVVRAIDQAIEKLRALDRERLSKITDNVDRLGNSLQEITKHIRAIGDAFDRMNAPGVGVGDTTEAQANADAILERIRRQAFAQRSLNQQLADSEKRAAHLRELIKADPENLKLQKRLAEEYRKQKDLGEQIADNAKEAVQAAKDAVAAARAHRLSVFDVRAAQAALSKSLQNDLNIAKRREAFLRREHELRRKDLDIAEQLISATQARRDIEAQIAAQLVEQRKARQFRALGLTATGEEIVPGVKRLKRELATIGDALKGTFLDTSTTRSLLSRIRKLLAGGLGALGRDVRAKIKEMLDDIDRQLKEGGGKGPQTQFAKRGIEQLIEGIGLSPEEIKALRQRLSRVGRRGTTPGRGAPGVFGFAIGAGGALVVHTHVHLDGKEVAVSTTKHQQKQRGRGSPSRRGVNPGI